MSLSDQDVDVLNYGREAAEQPSDNIRRYGQRAVEQGIQVAQVPVKKNKIGTPTSTGSPGTFPIADVSVRGENNRLKFSGVIRAEAERVPPGESIGDFNGYRTLYHALAEANQSDRLTIVFGTKDGSFRVYDSDQKKYIANVTMADSITITPREAPLSWPFLGSMRLVNLQHPGKKPWHERVKSASSDEDYLSLIRFATGLEKDEVNATSSHKEYIPGRLNFNRTLSLNGSTGFFVRDTENPGQLHDDPVRLNATKTASLPVVAFAIGTFCIIAYSSAYLISTIIHEATHEAHKLRAIDVVRVWQNSKSDNLHKWLKVQLKEKTKIAGRILTLEDYWQINEAISFGSATTETIARIDGFMSTYHDPNFPFEKSTIPTSQIHYKGLSDINNFWPSVNKELQNQLLDRVFRYYVDLDSDHQTRLKEYLNDAEGDFQIKLREKIS